MTRPESSDGDRVLVSYHTLRKVVGALGVGMPVVLALWGFALSDGLELQPSISDYYWLRTRDAFVGILFTLAWFLFTYRGYDRRDDRAGDLACVFALGVALFPTGETGWEAKVHFSCAAALFLVLAYFALCLFTKSSGDPTPRKLARNRVYRVSGVTMLGCIAAIALAKWLLDPTLVHNLRLVFWLETLALWAFGVSWFVKGEALLGDERPAPTSLASTLHAESPAPD